MVIEIGRKIWMCARQPLRLDRLVHLVIHYDDDDDCDGGGDWSREIIDKLLIRIVVRGSWIHITADHNAFDEKLYVL